MGVAGLIGDRSVHDHQHVQDTCCWGFEAMENFWWVGLCHARKTGDSIGYGNASRLDMAADLYRTC